MPFIAFASLAGVIGFAEKCPRDALPIGRDDDLDKLKTVVSAIARRSYDNETLLVPGMPEATTGFNAIKAALSFYSRVESRLKDGAS